MRCERCGGYAKRRTRIFNIGGKRPELLVCSTRFQKECDRTDVGTGEVASGKKDGLALYDRFMLETQENIEAVTRIRFLVVRSRGELSTDDCDEIAGLCDRIANSLRANPTKQDIAADVRRNT